MPASRPLNSHDDDETIRAGAMKTSDRAVDVAMERLRAAAREQRSAIEELIALGAVRSRSLVGDLGERLAADYHGVDLDWHGRRGNAYDLIDRRDRRDEHRADAWRV